jgi:HD-GYP domain-containing protein (c-di-GMP phosphodiesterase class II)
MHFRFKIRFQSWVMLMTALLVTSLAAAFLFTVFQTFSRSSEEAAAERFSLVAQQASSQVQESIERSERFVSLQVRSAANQFILDGKLNREAKVPLFLAALEADPNVSSYFFALSNEELLQVIAIRGDARVQSALKAPEASYLAVRHTTLNSNATRSDHYQFFDRQHRKIGLREEPPRMLPTTRPWYVDALRNGGLTVTDPYLFGDTGELGITVAAPLPDKAGVLGTDISLRSVNVVLSQIELPPNGAIGIVSGKGNVIGFAGKGTAYAGLKIPPMTPAQSLENPLLSVLKEAPGGTPSHIRLLGKDQIKYVLTQREVNFTAGATFRVVVWAPLSDFTGAFRQAQRDVLLLSVFILLLLLPLAFIGSRRLARSLTSMAADSERLKRLDFSVQPHQPNSIVYEINTLGQAQLVMHDAIQKRTEALRQSQEKLSHLVDNGIRLSREQNRRLLLRKVLFSARDIAHCAAANLFLKTEHNTLVFAERTSDDSLPSIEIPLFDSHGAANEEFVVSYVAATNTPAVIDDVYTETRFDLSGTKRFSEESGFRAVSMLVVPLSPREGEVIGVIQLVNALDPVSGAIIPFPPEMIGFAEALAAQSAVAIENQNLIEAQKQLMDALVKLIAGAIDAKSPYTGGHCERVPELGIMLAEAATAVTEGPLAEFRFETDDEWREFRVGAWLHDCGKVTTPEYVVDKASKLETIYNRIHEIRTRFEVLLRDARISQLEAVAAGAESVQAQSEFDERKAQLLSDFEFIAECNLGGEFMASEKLERLRQIASQTWLRHYDDRKGLAHDELNRYTQTVQVLPVTEQLLSDKPQHIIPRGDAALLDPKWDFKVTVPQHLYNQGELYNLGIGRGTLTEEERFKINEHVMQSLMMLEKLPFPKNLRRVPEYAGTHHETLIGTGYPRKLSEAELSVPMRIMALADIFEALTASDRPYKKAKTLSEAIKILSFFKKDRHIDPTLFDLFLTSGVYLRYAEKYLRPEQIDKVDVSGFLS